MFRFLTGWKVQIRSISGKSVCKRRRQYHTGTVYTVVALALRMKAYRYCSLLKLNIF